MARREAQAYNTNANKKNQRRISILVTSQTLYHLKKMAAANGLGEKDIGQMVDKLMCTVLAKTGSHGK